MHDIRTDPFDALTTDESTGAPACEVIVAAEPPLLRGMLSRAISRVRGLHVCSELPDLAGLIPLLEHTVAQWVIVTLGPDRGMPEIISSVLATYPSIYVLGVATDGSEARIECAEGTIAVLADLSLAQMIRVLLPPRA